tara:strand:+ start:2975 stop:3844 length:870 start_codon:yes stop_codon:yes gene_type:complete
MDTADAFDPAATAAATGEWDPNDLPDDGFSAVFFGARRTGKTFLIEEVVSKLVAAGRRWSAAFLFSETAIVNQRQYEWISPVFKHDHVSEDTIGEIFKIQQKERSDAKKKGEDDDNIPHVLVVADDVISDPTVRHSRVINKLYTQGRHYKIDVIILSQSIGGGSGLPPVVRMNADAVVVFRPRSVRDRELISEWFLGIIESEGKGLRAGREYMKHVTLEPFTAMVVDLAKQNVNELTDYVFRYKAEEKGVEPFRIGVEDHWDGFNLRDIYGKTDGTPKQPLLAYYKKKK